MSKNKIQILEDYIDRMTFLATKQFPKKNEAKIRKLITKQVYSQVQNFKIEWDNAYKNIHGESTFLGLTEWITKHSPIIAGNGTLFMQQSEIISPNSVMSLQLIDFRDAIKGEMFQLMELDDSDPHVINAKNNTQLAFKQSGNSMYGGSGNKVSAFYDVWCAPATTLTAQQVISTMYGLFELLIANKYDFISINEYFDFVYKALSETKKIDKRCVLISKDIIIEDTLNRLYHATDMERISITNFIDSLSDEDATNIYYHLNMKEFIYRNRFVCDMISDIFNSIKIYEVLTPDTFHTNMPDELVGMFDTLQAYSKFRDNKAFINPNNPPEEIKDKLASFFELIRHHCISSFISFDRIYRLKNFKRYAVGTIDSDSNFIILDDMVEFFDTVYRKSDYIKYNNPNDLNYVFIRVNTIMYIITNISSIGLYNYSINAGIQGDYAKMYKMKNELLVFNMLLSDVKKRYMLKMIIREGVYLPKPKYDIKGFDFRKSAVSDKIEEAFTSICKKYILDANDVSVNGMIKDLLELQNIIRTSILNGETTYLPICNVKGSEAYADPERMQSVRGSVFWNTLYPGDAVQMKGYLLKLTLLTKEDCMQLKDYINPNIFDKLMYMVFEDVDSVFISKRYKNVVDENGRTTSEFASYNYKGLQCIVIPFGRQIPDYLIQFCDINTVVNNILAPMIAVLKLFNIPLQTEGKIFTSTNRQTSLISNIIKF